MKPKILIVVEGGIVQSVHADQDIQFVVIDYDSSSDEPVIVGEINEPDTVLKEEDKFYDMYSKSSTDQDEIFVHKALKKLKF